MVIQEIRREDIRFMAGSIAYHVFVSMLPILLLVTFLVSVFGSDQFVASVLELTGTFLPATSQEVLAEALRNAAGSIGLSVVGVGVLVWGTSKIFRAMDAAFAEVYDTERKVSVVDQFYDALVVVFALAVAIIGAVLFGSVIRIPATVPLARPLNGLLAILGLAVAFLPLYYVFPNRDVSVREILPGTFVAAVGWMGLKWLFDLYVSVSNQPDIYGLLGTLVLFVTWLYVGSLVLLMGATVNAALASHNGLWKTQQRSKRQFGQPITDAEGFEDRLEELVIEANEADIPKEEIKRLLRQQAETVGRVLTTADEGVWEQR